MKNRIFSILLCLCMAITLLPTAALAEGEGQETRQFTVTLTVTPEESSSHITQIRYRLDQGNKNELSNYTEPFVLDKGNGAVLWIIMEDGYIAQWPDGLQSNLYHIANIQEDLHLNVTAVTEGTETAEKNGQFQGLPAAVDAIGSLLVNSANFPDLCFLSEIRKLSAAGDDVLTVEEVNAITALDVSGKGIETLSGIEFFSALTTLNCSGNRLAALDLSHNNALTTLNADNQTVYGYCLPDQGYFSVPLTQFSGLELGKVSNVTNAEYNGITGILTRAASPISYTYQVDESRTMEVSVELGSGGMKNNTADDAMTAGTPSWYAEGEDYRFVCSGYNETITTDTLDFMRAQSKKWYEADEAFLRKAVFRQEYTLAFQLDEKVKIDPDKLPELTVYYEGENTSQIPNKLFVPTVDSAAWDPALRLLTYQVSFSMNAYQVLNENDRDGLPNGDLLLDEMVKRDYAAFRYALTLSVDAETYQGSDSLTLACCCGAVRKEYYIIPTETGIAVPSQTVSLACGQAWTINTKITSYTPTAVVKVPNEQSAAQDVFRVALSDSDGSNGTVRAEISQTGAGSVTLPTVYFTSLTGNPENIYIRQLEGNDYRYLYDTDAWKLSLVTNMDGESLSVSTASYTRGAVTADSAVFTNKVIPEVTANNITVTYTGEAVPADKITGTAQVGGTDVAGTWSWKDGSAVTNAADSGTKTVVFTPTDTENYIVVETTITLTIRKAAPTVTANNITVTYTGAAVPAGKITGTAQVDGKDVAGTWSWKDGSAVTNAADSGTKTVVFTPTDTANYTSVETTITLTIRMTVFTVINDNINMSNTGSAVSADTISTTTETTTNDDGSTTTTVTNQTTGTVTETTEYPDGSTVVTETKKDGSSTTTDKQVSGVTTVTKTDADGSTTARVTVPSTVKGGVTISIPVDLGDADGTVSVAVTYPDGTKETVTGSYSGGKISLSVDGSATIEILDDFVPLAAFPFTDVGESDWFYADVAYVLEQGLMQGTSETTFDPYMTTSRGMIVTVLYRLEDEPAVFGNCPFDDVASGSYYENAITWASQFDIVEGYGNGKFGPDDPITREQLAAIFWRYAQYKSYDVSVGEDTNILSYNDAFDVSEYAISAMQWACGAGLMQGDGDKLMPQGEAQRCQVAAILHRFCENVK